MHKKLDILMKAISHFYSKPSTEISTDSKPWADVKFITENGEDLTEHKKNCTINLVVWK